MCVRTSASSTRQAAVHQRAHEHDAAARAVVLVLEREIGRARLEAEAAVHARVDARARVGRAACREWRRYRGMGDGDRLHASSPRMPGLRMRSGSKALRTPTDRESSARRRRRAMARATPAAARRRAVPRCCSAPTMPRSRASSSSSCPLAGRMQRTTPRDSVACAEPARTLDDGGRALPQRGATRDGAVLSRIDRRAGRLASPPARPTPTSATSRALAERARATSAAARTSVSFPPSRSEQRGISRRCPSERARVPGDTSSRGQRGVFGRAQPLASASRRAGSPRRWCGRAREARAAARSPR